MTRLNDAVSEMATTNVRIAVGLVEALAFVVVNLIALWIGHPMSVDTDLAIGGFILIQQGLDVTQFGIKRWTFQAEAHDTPLREDVTPPKQAAQPAAQPTDHVSGVG